MLYDGNEPLRTLKPRDLEPFLKRGEIEITKGEIKDRSKGDILSKAIVLVQTGWFILQCIARRVEGLPITELELMTLAYATLNFVTYAVWWEKPLNVRYPFRVVARRDSTGRGSKILDDEKGWNRNRVSENTSIVGSVIQGGIVPKIPTVIGSETTPVVRDAQGTILKTTDGAGQAPRDATRKAVDSTQGMGRTRSRIRNYKICRAIEAFYRMGLGDSMGTTEAMQVPTFYPGATYHPMHPEQSGDPGHKSGSGHWLVALPGVVVGTTFGGIHCFAWSFTFPSQTEQRLWRICSGIIVGIPMLMWMATAVVLSRPNTPLVKKVPVVVAYALAVLYIIARVVLLVLVFMSLRSLSPEAYITVHWTTFIPHI